MTSTSAFPGADISSEQDRAVWEIVFQEHAGPRRYFFGGSGITVCYEIGEDNLPADAGERDAELLQQEYQGRGDTLWAEFCESPECHNASEDEDQDDLYQEWLDSYEAEEPDQQEQLDYLMGLVGCARYDDPDAVAIIGCGDWSDYWPEIDVDGEYTGRLVGHEPGFFSVGGDAMILASEADCRASGWGIDREEGQAWELAKLEICPNAEWWRVFSSAGFDGIDETDEDEAAGDLVSKIIDRLERAHYRVEMATGQRATFHGWNGANTFTRGCHTGVGTFDSLGDQEWDALVDLVDKAVKAWRTKWIANR